MTVALQPDGKVAADLHFMQHWFECTPPARARTLCY